MIEEREQIKRELARVALGQVEGLSGRALASRVTALRTLERVTRDADNADPPEPIQEHGDYPVDDLGAFCPIPSPAWWALWRSAAGCDYEAGDAREAAAIERWQRSGGAWEWQRRGCPWGRSAWEADPSRWHEALAALDG